jgi:hypothetical protein
MISPSMRDEVLRELEKLGAADQKRVMDFVRVGHGRSSRHSGLGADSIRRNPVRTVCR